MSPILSLVLATTLSQAEPTREHVQLIAVAIEMHAATQQAPTKQAATDLSIRYTPAASAQLDSAAPVTTDARASIVYSLATPVFRDLL